LPAGGLAPLPAAGLPLATLPFAGVELPLAENLGAPSTSSLAPQAESAKANTKLDPSASAIRDVRELGEPEASFVFSSSPSCCSDCRQIIV